MAREKTSVAEKIMKLFPNENIVLNKKFNNRKPLIWFKNHNLTIEADEGNHENYDLDDEKESWFFESLKLICLIMQHKLI